MPTKHGESRTRALGVVVPAFDLGGSAASDPTGVSASAAQQVEHAFARANNLVVAATLSGLTRELPRPERAMKRHLDEADTESLRRVLPDRRQSVLRGQRETLAHEERLLAEPEPDWEDLAATRTAAALLEGLSETEEAALLCIQAALDRIAQGTYGTCLACDGPIEEKRLRAVPDTYLCGACAGTGPAHTS